MISHKKLECLSTGQEIDDDLLILQNSKSREPALLRTIYLNKEFNVNDGRPGIYRFSDWLPIRKILTCESRPVTYKSKGLASVLCLPNLYITFNGYWPEKGALMHTGTFKECEAYSVCARFPVKSGKILVIASAGNTARAFIKVCSENNIPLAVVVPEKNLNELWTKDKINPCVKIIAAGKDSDYLDAIKLSGIISSFDNFQNEGGAKNVARRDGMGTTVLSAAAFIGKIPDYYFQAVGSGTGAIAAYEANLRLNQSGQYAKKMMSLQVSQNIPFTPIYNAWKNNSSQIEDMDEKTAKEQIDEVNAKVLTNRKPPYSIAGGLYEALKKTNGDVIDITNEEGLKAEKLFFETEKRSICPEAGIALASLIKKVKEGNIEKDAVIMLNVTGGGIKEYKSSFDVSCIKPDMIIDREDFGIESIRGKINLIFK